jgi:hypothetical protein
MRTGMILGATLLVSAGAQAQSPSYAQSAAAFCCIGGGCAACLSSGGQTPHLNLTLGAPADAGDALVVGMTWTTTSSNVPVLSDSLGNTYSTAVGPTIGPDGNVSAVAYALSIDGGVVTVSMTGRPTDTYYNLALVEYAGIDSHEPLDSTAVGVDDAGSLQMVSPSLVTTAAGDLLVALGVSNLSVTAAGPGFVLRLNSDSEGLEDALVGSPGSYVATMQSGQSGWTLSAAAFRAAAAGAMDGGGDAGRESTDAGPERIADGGLDAGAASSDAGMPTDGGASPDGGQGRRDAGTNALPWRLTVGCSGAQGAASWLGLLAVLAWGLQAPGYGERRRR